MTKHEAAMARYTAAKAAYLAAVASGAESEMFPDASESKVAREFYEARAAL